MEKYFILLAIGTILKVLRLGKLIRLITLRILYPNATIEQVESFEKHTKQNIYIQWIKKDEKSE